MQTETESLPWSQDTWDAIHKAVYDETQRVVIAPKFLPLYGPIYGPARDVKGSRMEKTRLGNRCSHISGLLVKVALTFGP